MGLSGPLIFLDIGTFQHGLGLYNENFEGYYTGVIVYLLVTVIPTILILTLQKPQARQHHISIIVFKPVSAPQNDLYTQPMPNESEQLFDL